MELRDVIEQRTSVRNFLADPIPVEDIRELVRLGACAPSVNNYQPWRFVAVTKKAVMGEMADIISEKISEIPSNDSRVAQNVKSQVEWYATFFKDAPVVIALAMESYESVMEKGCGVSHDEVNRMRNHPDIQSAGAAIQNLLLAAVDMGYGACWMSAPMVACQELTQILKLENQFKLIAFVALGKPVTKAKPREKKEISEIFRLIE